MFGYLTVGTNNLDAAIRFYDPLFLDLGYKRVFEFERGVYYGRTHMEFGVLKPFDGRSATTGNGSMVALKALDRDQVHAVHARALALGGRTEGPPGVRGDPSMGFYGAYFRDLDGNKLCVFTMTEPAN